MKLLRSGNPSLSEKTFERRPQDELIMGETMSLNGTINKAGILLVLMLVPAYYAMQLVANGPVFESAFGYVIGGSLAGFVLALIITFKKNIAPILAPLYAVLQGLVVGFISGIYNYQFDGIVLQAIGLTACIFLSVLLLYRFQILQATEKFKFIVGAATMGIMLYYLVSIIGRFVGFTLPLIHDSGTFGIVFSVAVVAIAALNLVMDFDVIDKGIEAQAPKYMEWYASFGLLVTLIWLYLEILRLLSKLRRD